MLRASLSWVESKQNHKESKKITRNPKNFTTITCVDAACIFVLGGGRVAEKYRGGESMLSIIGHMMHVMIYSFFFSFNFLAFNLKGDF